jgi:hypothetical protein
MREDHINKMMQEFFSILIFIGMGAFFANFLDISRFYPCHPSLLQNKIQTIKKSEKCLHHFVDLSSKSNGICLIDVVSKL